MRIGIRLRKAGEQLSLFRPVTVHAHQRHVKHGVEVVHEHQRHVKHLDRAGPAAPAKGQKGHRAPPARPEGAFDGRTPDEIGRTVVSNAVRLREDPDVAAMWHIPADAADEETWTEADLPDLLGIPRRDHAGQPEPLEHRIAWARWTFEHVVNDLGIRGLELDPKQRERYLQRGWLLEPWALAAVITDAIEPDQEFRLADVTREEATAFVKKHHSHLSEINLRGAMFLLGLKRGERLVAVAIAGTPTAPWSKAGPETILELTRVASDGTTLNASSKLTGRILDLLPRTGRTRFVTYTFPGEAGTSYKALKDKGLRPVGISSDHSTQTRREGGSSRSANAASGKKLRWEAGPDAAPARWDLLETFR